MKNNIAKGILALVAGIVIGWFAVPAGETSVSSSKHGSAQVLRKLAEAGEIIDSEQRDMAVKLTLSETKATEMEALADPVMKLAARRPDMSIRDEFLNRWGELAPRNALAYLGSEAPFSQWEPVLTAWGRTNPDDAAASFHPEEKELSKNSRAEARALLAGIAEADPVKAIHFADRYSLADLTRLEYKDMGGAVAEPSFEPSGSYQKAIAKWIRHDPAAAFEVMFTLKSIEVRDQALNELFFFEWPYHDPEAAKAGAMRLWESAQLAGDSRVPIHSIELVKSLARNYGELNGAKAYEQAISLADPNQRLSALDGAFEGWTEWGKEHLPAVADFIATRLNSEEQTSVEAEMLVHVAEWIAGWLAKSGENDEGIAKAADWIEKLPPGEAHDAAIRGIVSASLWNPEQQKKPEEWVNALPASHQKDIAVAEMAANISGKKPAKAMDLAATIADPAIRAETLAHVAAPFVSKEKGGTKAFDIGKWSSQNPKIGEELRAAAE